MNIRIQILFISLLCLALPAAVQAYTYTNSDGVWTYTTNGATATITFYSGAGGALQVPSIVNGNLVITIGDGGHVFPNRGVTSVVIPYGVISIAAQAFGASHDLTSVTIPDSVISIGSAAFNMCSLTNASIPNSVLSLGDSAFYQCLSLTSVSIGNSVPRIGAYAFYYCTSLTSVSVPNSVTSIGDYAFYEDSSLTNITFPNGLTNIGSAAFGYCSSLTSVTIPKSLTSIGGNAFGACNQLRSAYFLGNAPPDVGTAFALGTPATVYYMPGTTGWGPTFGSRPTMLWNPQAVALGVVGGQFGFTITGPTNAVIVVVACTNVANPVWLPVSTNTLTGGTSSFSDPQSSSYPIRFYRFRSP